MKTRQGKSGIHFRLRWEYLILIVLMGLFALKFLDKTGQIQTLARQQAALSYDNHRLSAENKQLQRDIRYYATDQYAQDAARGLLAYTKPGETSIEVQPPVAQRIARVRAAPRRAAAPPASSWQQWWDAFTR